MAIEAAYIVPHPPLIIPAVGKGTEREINETVESYRRISEQTAEISPELIIFISPHSVSYADYIHIAPGGFADGSFKDFGAAQVNVKLNYDEAFVKEVESLCESGGFPAGSRGEKSPELDHGVMIPAYFINQSIDERGQSYLAARVSVSGLSLYEHYRFGEYLRQAAEALNRRTVVIAGGDLSHRLSEKGPYGFHKSAPLFDAEIKRVIAGGDFGGFLNFSEEDCNKAGECGLRAFLIMAGALDGKKVAAKLLSYEAPFGVGYAVGSFAPAGEDTARRFGKIFLEKINERRKNESPYVRLARKTLEAFVRGESMDEDIPNEMLNIRAGVFVCVKKAGRLRGCIGSIYPITKNIAEEIKMNAVSAGTKDERFDPVEDFELEELSYGVDVMDMPEAIASQAELDVKKYGVIVTSGSKKGLLLPDLEGVDTVERQIEIAKSKAGIKQGEKVELLRFKVTRYS